MKKKIMIASIIFISVFAVGIIKYRSKSAVAPNNAVWVKTTKVQETNLPVNVRAIGTLVAPSVEISPEISGHIRKIYFQDGMFVKQDESLIQLDDALYKAKYESTKAKLAFSVNDYKRKNLLAKKGVISQQAIDQAIADYKEIKANTEENAVMVNKMQLKAPFDGVVGKSKMNPGDYVTTGQSIVTLTDIKHLRIEYNVPENFLPLVKRGQEVAITSTTYPGKIFVGKVLFISPTINIENRSVSLYAEVTNNNNELAAGMLVNVKQSLEKKEKVMMIPARSLVPVLDGEQVYKVTDGKAYGVNVVIGKRNNENVQIIKGLHTGDIIITDGQLKVKNGLPVQIKS